MTLFPELDAEEILARTAELWHLSTPLPVPRGEWLTCGACGAREPHAREWRIGPRSKVGADPAEHRLTHRCDVMFKCSRCGAVWAHGLAITAAMARTYGARGDRVRVWDWRDARGLLIGHTIDV